MEIRETADLENVDALILPGGESTSIGSAIADCPGDMLGKLRDKSLMLSATLQALSIVTLQCQV